MEAERKAVGWRQKGRLELESLRSLLVEQLGAVLRVERSAVGEESSGEQAVSHQLC